VAFALAHPSRQGRDVLPFARDGRVRRVVFRHVAGAAAAGGVGVGFDGRRHEVGGGVGRFAGDVSFYFLDCRVVRWIGWGMKCGGRERLGTGAAAAIGDAG